MTLPKRPRDTNQLAKMVVDIAVCEPMPEKAIPANSSQARVAGRLGGAARSASLDELRRSEIAKAAAQARWKKRDRTDA